MPVAVRRSFESNHKLLALMFALGLAGCYGGLTPDEQVDKAFSDNPTGRLQTAKFEGTVTIDGQAPGKDYGMLHVVLVPADKYQDPAKAQRWQAPVDAEGHFVFHTYLKDDGAPIGKYVAVFLDPSAVTASETQPRRGGIGHSFGGMKSGADKLKNLYNDPEVNIKNPAFEVNLQPPGIPDKTFNLEVAGKEGPRTPGRYAVQGITTATFQYQ